MSNQVTVYFFSKHDVASDQTIRSQRPATLEAIRRSAGVPLMETAQEIDAADLDDVGFRRREPAESNTVPPRERPDSN